MFRDLFSIFYFDNGTIVGNTNIFRCDTLFYGDVGMHTEHVVIAVHGDEKFRLYLFMDPHSLFTIAVAGCVHVGCVIGDDVRSLAREVVFEFLHGAFVARDDGRREDDRVGLLQADVFVGLVADARERSEFIALCAGRKNYHFLRRILSHVFDRDHGVVFVFDESELACDLDIGAHGPAIDDYFFVVLLGEMHDADETLEVRSEHGDDEAPLGFFDYLFERAIHIDLWNGPSRLPYIGRIHEEREDVPIFEDTKLALLFVGRFTVNMRELDVAGKDDVAPRRLDDDAHRIRHGVRDAEKSDGRSP